MNKPTITPDVVMSLVVLHDSLDNLDQTVHGIINTPIPEGHQGMVTIPSEVLVALYTLTRSAVPFFIDSVKKEGMEEAINEMAGKMQDASEIAEAIIAKAKSTTQ